MRENRDYLYHHVPAEHAGSISDQRAWVSELIDRIEAAIHPDTAPVKVTKEQDAEDDKHIRLTASEAARLLESIDPAPLRGLRDLAILSLLLCTGLREAELCNLSIEDLRQSFGGELALRVRDGKGCKKRLIPYGERSWCLVIVDRWVERAGIEAGPVFRNVTKAGRAGDNALNVRDVQRTVKRYSVIRGGTVIKPAPHDLRRSYAKQLYREGMPLLAIQQNLGHSSSKTTEGYIGTLDASDRAPGAGFVFDVSRLGG